MSGSDANDNDVWYVKAGIKRAWWYAGATVLFGEYAQYEDQFTGVCGTGAQGTLGGESAFQECFVNGAAFGASGKNFTGGDIDITSSRVNRWGLGVVQEIELGSNAPLGQLAAP